jgi:hypothetical protein
MRCRLVSLTRGGGVVCLETVSKWDAAGFHRQLTRIATRKIPTRRHLRRAIMTLSGRLMTVGKRSALGIYV